MTKATETLSPIQQELLNRADSIFNSISKAASTSLDFAKEQLPDIAIQFIMYQRVYLTLMLIVGVFILAGAFKLFQKAFIKSRTNHYDETVGWFIFGIITTLFGLIIFFNYIKATIMVWFAPKLFLIQGMIELSKSI